MPCLLPSTIPHLTPYPSFPLPLFPGRPGGAFSSYEIQFSPSQDFIVVHTKVETSTTTALIDPETWKKILLIQPSTVRSVYRRVIGTKADNTTTSSEDQSLIVQPQQTVGSPTISNTQIGFLPTLAWKNYYNIKFKVSFGNDTSFSEKKTFTFNIENPTDNGGEFTNTLHLSQWMAIKKLVKNASGSTIYWSVESWDGLGRPAITPLMSFVLTD